MRHLLTALVVAATTVVMPTTASGNNQEVADQIAKRLEASGRLRDYTIGVKYQDGTAWLQGRVHSQRQVDTALETVFQTPGVTRVVNNLTVGPSRAAKTPAGKPPTAKLPADDPPQTDSTFRFGNVQSNLAGSRAGTAQRVSNSFSQAPVKKVAAVQPQPALPRTALRATDVKVPGRPIPIAFTQAAAMPGPAGGPIPAYVSRAGGDVAPARYDQPHMPNYSWPSYAAYPNYAALTYPKQYSPTAWPFIGPFYPYPQVPLGWRKVTLEWDDGWWFLDFSNSPRCCGH